MTNYEALYNQAMAHNAMLRDAIDAADSCLLSYKMGELAGWEIALYSRKREAALNATGPDVEAWMINFQNKSIDTTIKLYESEMQQLATVTAERDAELVAENERIGGLAEEWAGKYHALQAENERLKEMINANPAQA
jgi:hypothetical protein